jgi:hypothetical protein
LGHITAENKLILRIFVTKKRDSTSIQSWDFPIVVNNRRSKDIGILSSTTKQSCRHQNLKPGVSARRRLSLLTAGVGQVSDSPVSLNNSLSILSSRIMRVFLKPSSLPSALACIHRSPRLRRLLRTQAQYEYTPREHHDFSEFPRSAEMATPRQVI